MAKNTFHAAATRGHADHGWLDTHHTFSFAGYYNPERVHFGVLRVLNDDVVKGGYGFGKHPHDNMEIITIVLNGALEHQDSMGHTQAIRPNEVQVMSAGTGVTHSEYNHEKEVPVNFLQIWIFPDKANVQPRYDQKEFDANARVNKLQMLVSPMDKQDEGLKIHQDAWIYRATLDPEQTIDFKPHTADHGVYVFLIDGKIDINGQEMDHRDGLGIEGAGEIKITASALADFILLEVPMK